MQKIKRPQQQNESASSNFSAAQTVTWLRLESTTAMTVRLPFSSSAKLFSSQLACKTGKHNDA
jgi:hypothetical protein